MENWIRKHTGIFPWVSCKAWYIFGEKDSSTVIYCLALQRVPLALRRSKAWGDFGCAQCFDVEGEIKDLKGAKDITVEMVKAVDPKLKNDLKRTAKTSFEGLWNKNPSITASKILQKMLRNFRKPNYG
ncbi:eIF-2-alpha kinase GCN2-like [Prunus yedoensis var. nudiflora]|uniref:eIF-2-alpha kinase GCN2-like n=1 Tax=Prunus yedoensis var. nudiflora TaxID=2094558 RepID=A0A314Y036_PRUYE|nr:eIF-2-alpha kinase GCN2-like [Prunus yedoensis var. nudiflora]